MEKITTTIKIPKNMYDDIKEKNMKYIQIFMRGYEEINKDPEIYRQHIKNTQDSEKMLLDIATLRQELSIIKASLRVDRFIQEQLRPQKE